MKFQQKIWNLKDVLPSHSGPKFEAEVKKLEDELRKFEGFKSKLSEKSSATDFKTALHLYEQILERNARFKWYAYMLFSQDTTSQEARTIKTRMDELDKDVTNRTVFYKLWLTRLGEKAAQKFTANVESDYAYYIMKLRKLKDHVLDEAVEQAIKMKNTTGREALIQLYQQITSAFGYKVRVDGKTLKDKDGKTKNFVYGELVSIVFGPDAKKREAAYKAMYREYVPRRNILGEIYITLIRDWKNEYLETRNYKSPISVFNLANDVPDEAVNTLLTVCKNNSHVFQEFFALKTRLLGVDQMTRYHIYAPTLKSQKKIQYSEAVNMVLNAYDSFHPKLKEYATKIFMQNHVDAQLRKGKLSGAYCMSVTPKILPYVFLNYADTVSHLLSIAHEAGHAIHTMLGSNHSQLTFHAHTPLAEIASIFGELILSEQMLQQEKDLQTKQDLLVLNLSDLYATIQRQAYFTMFEKDAHKAVEKNVTIDKLADMYGKGLKEQFGSVVKVPKEFKWEWTAIPHIYRYPFYCWSYSFGNLVTLGLYDRYKEEGESFKPKYLKILSYGSSESPAKILGEVGVDIQSKKFWQGGFNIIKNMINDLKKLQN